MGDELKQVIIYTDGAAVPNPGAGGYGVVLRFGQHKKELSGGFQRTTNNRMELMAVIVGLETLKERCQVKLHSDSQYIVNAVTSGSAFRWRSNGWGMNQSGSKKAKNPDLWERLLAAYERHEVEMVWVKGHAGIDDNERCDVLAMEACRQPGLPPDPGFVESAVEDDRLLRLEAQMIRLNRLPGILKDALSKEVVSQFQGDMQTKLKLLNEKEKDIYEACCQYGPLQGEALMKKAGYRYSSWSKATMSRLVKIGLFESTSAGYRATEIPKQQDRTKDGTA